MTTTTSTYNRVELDKKLKAVDDSTIYNELTSEDEKTKFVKGYKNIFKNKFLPIYPKFADACRTASPMILHWIVSELNKLSPTGKHYAEVSEDKKINCDLSVMQAIAAQWVSDEDEVQDVINKINSDPKYQGSSKKIERERTHAIIRELRVKTENHPSSQQFNRLVAAMTNWNNNQFIRIAGSPGNNVPFALSIQHTSSNRDHIFGGRNVSRPMRAGYMDTENTTIVFDISAMDPTTIANLSGDVAMATALAAPGGIYQVIMDMCNCSRSEAKVIWMKIMYDYSADTSNLDYRLKKLTGSERVGTNFYTKFPMFKRFIESCRTKVEGSIIELPYGHILVSDNSSATIARIAQGLGADIIRYWIVQLHSNKDRSPTPVTVIDSLHDDVMVSVPGTISDSDLKALTTWVHQHLTSSVEHVISTYSLGKGKVIAPYTIEADVYQPNQRWGNGTELKMVDDLLEHIDQQVQHAKTVLELKGDKVTDPIHYANGVALQNTTTEVAMLVEQRGGVVENILLNRTATAPEDKYLGAHPFGKTLLEHICTSISTYTKESNQQLFFIGADQGVGKSQFINEIFKHKPPQNRKPDEKIGAAIKEIIGLSKTIPTDFKYTTSTLPTDIPPVAVAIIPRVVLVQRQHDEFAKFLKNTEIVSTGMYSVQERKPDGTISVRKDIAPAAVFTKQRARALVTTPNSIASKANAIGKRPIGITVFDEVQLTTSGYDSSLFGIDQLDSSLECIRDRLCLKSPVTLALDADITPQSVNWLSGQWLGSSSSSNALKTKLDMWYLRVTQVEDRVCTVYPDKKTMINHINNIVRAAKPRKNKPNIKQSLMVIGCNSATACISYRNRLQGLNPQLSIIAITKDTKHEKDNYQTIKRQLLEADVILYSPTLSTGISFNASEDADLVVEIAQAQQVYFMYENTNTINYHGVLQSLFRVRDCKDINIHYASSAVRTDETTTDEVAAQATNVLNYITDSANRSEITEVMPNVATYGSGYKDKKLDAIRAELSATMSAKEVAKQYRLDFEKYDHGTDSAIRTLAARGFIVKSHNENTKEYVFDGALYTDAELAVFKAYNEAFAEAVVSRGLITHEMLANALLVKEYKNEMYDNTDLYRMWIANVMVRSVRPRYESYNDEIEPEFVMHVCKTNPKVHSVIDANLTAGFGAAYQSAIKLVTENNSFNLFNELKHMFDFPSIVAEAKVQLQKTQEKQSSSYWVTVNLAKIMFGNETIRDCDKATVVNQLKLIPEYESKLKACGVRSITPFGSKAISNVCTVVNSSRNGIYIYTSKFPTTVKNKSVTLTKLNIMIPVNAFGYLLSL